MKKWTLLLITGVFLSCMPKKDAAAESDVALGMLRDTLTAELMQLHKLGHINGFGVAIVNPDTVLYTRGFGFSDVGTKTPYTANTIQNIGSVSKTLIGICLLKAQELGKLQLDDPVNDHLPFEVRNPHYPEDPITLRQLATHTSSIQDTEYYDQKSYILKEALTGSDTSLNIHEDFNPPDARIPLMAFLENTLSQEGSWYRESGFLRHRPGERFAYTNVGATLAAAALETATGMGFDAFATQYILTPLGMEASGWSFDGIDLSRHSTLYSNTDTPLPYYSLITYPDGGLITSPTDLSKYLRELINGYSGKGTLLSKAGYRELFRPQLGASHLPDRDTENDYDDEYNSGIFMGFTPRGYIGHTGGDPGIASFMFFNPKTKTGRLLMINTSIVDQDGVDQFLSTWNTLSSFEAKMDSIVTNK